MEVIASALFYLGAALAAFALATFAFRLLRRRGGRARALVVALVGVLLALVALVLPAREIVVARPTQRLDGLAPRFQFHERHALAVAAEPAAVDLAIRSVTADEISLYRTLTWLRRRGRRGPESLLDAPPGVPMLTLATRTGFRMLADEPGREVVLGVALPVTEAARREVQAIRAEGKRPLPAPADGYAMAAMNFRVVPDGRGGSIVSTETRVHAPDVEARRGFARYWRVIYPGSALIRRGWLAAIRRRAEGDAAHAARVRVR